MLRGKNMYNGAKTFMKLHLNVYTKIIYTRIIFRCKISQKSTLQLKQQHVNMAQADLQFPLRLWDAGNVYLLALSSWKVNIAENFIAVMGS